MRTPAVGTVVALACVAFSGCLGADSDHTPLTEDEVLTQERGSNDDPFELRVDVRVFGHLPPALPGFADPGQRDGATQPTMPQPGQLLQTAIEEETEPLADADVTVYAENEPIARGVTTRTGTIAFDLRPDQVVQLSVNHDDHTEELSQRLALASPQGGAPTATACPKPPTPCLTNSHSNATAIHLQGRSAQITLVVFHPLIQRELETSTGQHVSLFVGSPAPAPTWRPTFVALSASPELGAIAFERVRHTYAAMQWQNSATATADLDLGLGCTSQAPQVRTTDGTPIRLLEMSSHELKLEWPDMPSHDPDQCQALYAGPLVHTATNTDVTTTITFELAGPRQ